MTSIKVPVLTVSLAGFQFLLCSPCSLESRTTFGVKMLKKTVTKAKSIAKKAVKRARAAVSRAKKLSHKYNAQK